MEVQFDKARLEDYDDVIDLGNYVFSQAHRPHDFPASLPKLYKREYFMDGIHYLAREGNRIKAAVGSYPLELEFSGPGLPKTTLKGMGIGMVSVHPYSRSRGYMKELMNRALEDMRRDGMVFSCLSGRRQRYEYFGYGRTGSRYTFSYNDDNIRHTLGQKWTTDLSFRPVGSGDQSLLDQIYAMHETKIARLKRSRERLYDTLSSWNWRIFAVLKGESFEGYFVYRSGEQCEISEIQLKDYSRLPEVLGLLQSEAKAGSILTPSGFHPIQIAAGPHEPEKIAALSRFAESYTQSPAYQFVVFDYLRFVAPFLKLKEKERNLADGVFVLQIEGHPRLRLAVERGAASITEIPGQGNADLGLKDLEALSFLFSPLASCNFPAIRKSVFLQSLLPLPLFYETADEI